MNDVLYMIIPCYNEQEVLQETAKRLLSEYNRLINNKIINNSSRIVFINDGSKDDTWEIIQNLHRENKLFSGINLSRNKGHQNALLAGLLTVKDDADMIISMDADLQDDISAIKDMIEKYYEGYDIVYGVRNKRNKDSFFKRFTAESFYKVTNKLGGEIIYNHADFRLLSKRVLDGLSQYKEVNLFLRGIIPMIGYDSTIVTYDRNERYAGTSKYPLKKMLSFAIEGITSLSIKPIRIVTGIGLSVFLISIIMLIYVLYKYYIGDTIIGWSSVTISVWFIGGIQLMSLGIIGEYIGKIYLESKKRPRFIIKDYINEKTKNN